MAQYLLSDDAKADIQEIVGTIRQNNARIAPRVRDELRRAMRRLADFPLLGHKREDLTCLPVRFWCVYSYLIVYLPETKPLQVVRVLHGARDVAQILADR